MQNLTVVGTGTTENQARLNQLRINYIAPAQRQLAVFWSWWMGQLIPLLPTNLQVAVAQRDQRHFIERDGDTLIIRGGTFRERSELLRTSLSSGDRTEVNLPGGAKTKVLLLTPEEVLVKPLTLPLATEENLREVLSFEIPRKTPFTADQVYYDYVVGSRDSRNKTLSVNLIMAPRKIVDPLLESLSSKALRTDVVTIVEADGTDVLPINLIPRNERSKRKNENLNRLNAAIVVVAAILLITTVSLPLVKKHNRIQQMEPQLVEAIAQAKHASELSREVERLLAGSTHLVKNKQTELSVLKILDELTRALPDNTWISRLDISTAGIQLQGQSSSSALLISILEGSPIFENVFFKSPVTQISNSGDERFHLSAEISRPGISDE